MLKDDLARLCRLCLNPGDWTIDVFNPRGTNGFLVWSIMGELVEIQCSPHDGLPSRICGACMEKLADFKAFKKTCIISRIKLLQLQMNVGLIIKEPFDDDVMLFDEVTDGRKLSESVPSEFCVKTEKGDVGLLPNADVGIKEEEPSSGEESTPDDLECSEAVESEPESADESSSQRDASDEETQPADSTGGENSVASATDACAATPSPSIALRSRPKCDAGAGGKAVLPSKEEAQRGEKRTREKSPLGGEGRIDEGAGGRKTGVARPSNQKSKDAYAATPSPSIALRSRPKCDAGAGGKAVLPSKEEAQRGAKRKRHKSPLGGEGRIDEGAGGRKTGVARPSNQKSKAGGPGGVGSFPCADCDCVFSSRKDLTKHVYKTHLTFICDHCKRVFKQKASLKSHIMRVHLNLRNFACSECGRKFSTACEVRLHAKHVHAKGPKETPFECEECGKRFSYKRSMRMHVDAIHKGLRPYACTRCPARFSQKDNLRTHVLSVHSEERSFSCDVCAQKFKRADHLKCHRATHEDLRDFKCADCGKEYNTMNALRIHMKQHSGITYKCPQCPKEFTQETLRDRHVLIHTGERVFQCASCPKAFKTKSDLRLHTRSHTGVKPHECRVCGKCFSVSSNLIHHMRGVHAGERPFSCDTCAKTFKSKASLQQHMETHTSGKGISCAQCDKRYKTKACLTIHVRNDHRSGAEERPFKCHLCSKAFRLNSILKAHEITHTDLKPFACEVCRKAFNKASNLSTHRKLHSGNRETFSCKQCNLKTVKKDYYLDHMKKKHGGGDGGVGDRSSDTSDDSE
ncbi:oocyte zinc finger protein XlCOF6-like isoform X2 [Ischnura elegans]|uniref:oocyte zinc finger protein XlCOF6-like isoform X2 n=1 Tax=Ischnura elegans TaxID=197161 RepID=UPI001ED86C7F|nr:oocyte zinc finger protein XlCOF6-like isoform X2 [Ischnura elegans]